MDSRAFYAELNKYAADLAEGNPSGFLFVISLSNPDKGTTEGTVSEVSVAVAAKLLTNRTHRPATEDEVAAYREMCDENIRRTRRAEMESNRTDTVSVAAAVVAAIDRQRLTDAVLAAEKPGKRAPKESQ